MKRARPAVLGLDDEPSQQSLVKRKQAVLGFDIDVVEPRKRCRPRVLGLDDDDVSPTAAQSSLQSQGEDECAPQLLAEPTMMNKEPPAEPYLEAPPGLAPPGLLVDSNEEPPAEPYLEAPPGLTPPGLVDDSNDQPPLQHEDSAVEVEVKLPDSIDQRDQISQDRFLRCASNNCQYRVHSSPLCGGFCCLRCFWRFKGKLGKNTRQKHSEHCERKCCSWDIAQASADPASSDAEELLPDAPKEAEWEEDEDKEGEAAAQKKLQELLQASEADMESRCWQLGPGPGHPGCFYKTFKECHGWPEDVVFWHCNADGDRGDFYCSLCRAAVLKQNPEIRFQKSVVATQMAQLGQVAAVTEKGPGHPRCEHFAYGGCTGSPRDALYQHSRQEELPGGSFYCGSCLERYRKQSPHSAFKQVEDTALTASQQGSDLLLVTLQSVDKGPERKIQ